MPVPVFRLYWITEIEAAMPPFLWQCKATLLSVLEAQMTIDNGLEVFSVAIYPIIKLTTEVWIAQINENVLFFLKCVRQSRSSSFILAMKLRPLPSRARSVKQAKSWGTMAINRDSLAIQQ
jgi:hypothetical protein